MILQYFFFLIDVNINHLVCDIYHIGQIALFCICTLKQ